MRNYLKLGDWNAICDRCGFKFKASMLRREWTNLMVCSRCFEVRHPQDLLRSRRELESVPWSRPEPSDVFVSPGDAILTETPGDGDFIFAEGGELILTET